MLPLLGVLGGGFGGRGVPKSKRRKLKSVIVNINYNDICRKVWVFKLFMELFRKNYPFLKDQGAF